MTGGVHYVETIGDCTLVLGDCRTILPTQGGMDCVITDPPYGIARTNHGGFGESRPMLANDDSQAVGQAVIDWCHEMELPLAAFASPRLPWRGKWRNLICWDKGEAVAGGGDIGKCLKLSWELIQVSRNGKLAGGRGGSVWRHVVTPQDFDNHPTEKPVALIERLLSTLFPQAETVFDPFMGSGTTGVACVRTGRRFFGCEIEQRYFDIACNRIRRALQEKRSELPLEAAT